MRKTGVGLSIGSKRTGARCDWKDGIGSGEATVFKLSLYFAYTAD